LQLWPRLKRFIKFNWMYLGHPRWDTNISPPELLAFISSHPPGRALDVGCGTGKNVVTLAEAGWQAQGIDFAAIAIWKARRRARRAGVAADFRLGDAAHLERLTGPFDLILDMGCLHNLTPRIQTNTIREIHRLLAPGGTFLLYTFLRTGPDANTPGLSPDMLAFLSSTLGLRQRQDGMDRNGRQSVWLTLGRADAGP
jgi:SAM-dependent methyltransferase